MLRQRLSLAAAVLGAAFFAFGALGGALEVAGYRAHAGESRGAGVVVLVVCLLLMLLSIRWAVHAEHRLRRGPKLRPTPRHLEPSTPPNEVHVPPVLRATARGKRQGPVAIATELLLFTGFAVGCVVGGINLLAEASHSRDVQRHGIRTYATVIDIDNIVHHGKTTDSYTAHLLVHYSEPVDGVTDGVVHYPRRYDGYVDERIQVLVDRKDAHYAEVPGHANVVRSQGIVTLVIAAAFAVIGGLVGYEVLFVARRRRDGAFRDPAAPGSPVPSPPATVQSNPPPPAPAATRNPAQVANRPDATTFDPNAGLPEPD